MRFSRLLTCLVPGFRRNGLAHIADLSATFKRAQRATSTPHRPRDVFGRCVSASPPLDCACYVPAELRPLLVIHQLTWRCVPDLRLRRTLKVRIDRLLAAEPPHIIFSMLPSSVVLSFSIAAAADVSSFTLASTSASFPCVIRLVLLACGSWVAVAVRGDVQGCACRRAQVTRAQAMRAHGRSERWRSERPGESCAPGRRERWTPED